MVEKCNVKSHQLLEAIDFFAQNLSFEQIVSYGYHFIHKIIGLESSGIFVLENGVFNLKHTFDASFDIQSFPYDNRMNLLATKFGRAMKNELTTYFDEAFIESEHITFAFPILVKNKTYAVIFAKSEDVNLSDEGCSSAIHGINQMVNKSAENAINFEQFEEANAELDKKIFNLLFINHSTKAFMSELDLKKLYQLCIDVISEITASTVTSFALLEPTLSKLVLRGYKDILTYENFYCEFETLDTTERICKVVYHIERDYDQLFKFFKEPEKFKTLQAEYVVLIIKKDILGFVTIGKNIGGEEYSTELLNQIESLASSIYIAISNAQYIQKISRQKNEITDQLRMIEALNRTTKIINSCESMSELAHITMRTVNLALDFEKALFAVYNGEELEVINAHGFDYAGSVSFDDHFIERYADELHFEPTQNRDACYINSELENAIGESNCFVSIPIIADENNEEPPLGYLLAFQSKTRLKDSQVLSLETITHSVAPIIKQLKHKEEMKKQLIVNQEYEFLKKLNASINHRDEYYLDFVVYFKKLHLKPFESFDTNPYKSLKIFIIRDMLFHISSKEVDESLFDGHLTVYDQNSFIEEVQVIC